MSDLEAGNAIGAQMKSPPGKSLRTVLREKELDQNGCSPSRKSLPTIWDMVSNEGAVMEPVQTE